MLEEIIYNHLCSRQELTELLTKYSNTAAIFNQFAPPDTDEGWGAEQYPRLVFSLNANADVERRIAGTLQLDVYVKNGTLSPENIAAVVKPSVDGYFFSDENNTYSMQWEATQYTAEADEPVTVISVLFSFLEYPSQLTTEEGGRDPIGVLNAFTKELYPNARIIAHDEITGAWMPSNTSPAIYWRHGERKTDEKMSGWAADFYEVTLYGHVIAPDMVVQNTIARTIIYELNQRRALEFPDGSWMRVDWDTKYRINADIRRDGQLEIKATYCEERRVPDSELLTKIYKED